MNRLLCKLSLHPEYLLIFIALLLPFALFVNLGLMPLISDEPTRAIVTLEMIISGNYITPTINGEYYYNKPPLFNWILAGYIQISGKENEFIFRLPTVISLIISGILIYFFSNKRLGKLNATIAALMLLTSVRILFWDSFQGLIDITYSMLTICSFAVLYYFSDKLNFLAMFVLTYLLTAFGYLMKGFPSLAFQGISLLVWLIHEKEIRKILIWQHFAGIVVFILITGTYYFAYMQTNSLEDVFNTLFNQSNRINSKEGTLLSWTNHFLMFPIEMIYEFAPWTLLLFLLFDKRVRLRTFSGKFFRFCLLIFTSNIIIYWISADMRPRYLFMLFPLLFIILIKAHHEAAILKTRAFRFSNSIFLILTFAGAFSLLLYPFWNETGNLPGVRITVAVLFLVSISAALISSVLPQFRILLLIIVMLSVRIGFNAFNLPARYNSYPDAGYRQGEINAGFLSKTYNLYVLGDTPFNHDASFYISRERRQIVTRTWEISDKQACYITDEKNLANFAGSIKNYEVLKEFNIKLNESRLYLIKMYDE
ncbi:MAG: glycosyltransferase family 39 protein [Bacteroidota bacterium]